MKMENAASSKQSNERESEFFERRRSPDDFPGVDRRQFAPSYQDLSPEAQDLGNAIDQYKLLNRRRYINLDELLGVMKSMGYSK